MFQNGCKFKFWSAFLRLSIMQLAARILKGTLYFYLPAMSRQVGVLVLCSIEYK